MNMLRTIGLLILALFYGFSAQAGAQKKVRVKLQLGRPADSNHLEILQFDVFSKHQLNFKRKLYDSGNTSANNWEFSAEQPVGIQIKFLKEEYPIWLYSGADVTIKTQGNVLQVSGQGAEAISAHREILSEFGMLTSPPSQPDGTYPPRSLPEFYEWNKVFDKKAGIVHKVIDQYAIKYPSERWELMKAYYLVFNEADRWMKFLLLGTNKAKYDLKQADLKRIYDRVIINKNQQWLFSHDGEARMMFYYFRYLDVFHLVLNHTDSGISATDKQEQAWQRLRLIDSLASGRLKDELITHLIVDRLIKPGGSSFPNDILPKAFPMITHPEYKDYIIKEYIRFQQREAKFEIADFFLLDMEGKQVRRKDMNYKTLVFHIKDPHLPEPDKLFKEAAKEFANATDVILAEISYGQKFEDWQRETKEKNKNSGGSSIKALYAPQTEDHQDFILNFYAVLKTPTMILYQNGGDKHKNLFTSSRFIRSLEKKGQDTIAASLEVIRNEAQKYDGPHIRTINGKTVVYKVSALKLETDTLSGKLPSEVEVTTGPETKPFQVRIKPVNAVPECSYPMPEGMLFLSDIEGNFDVFREFLIVQGVMDSTYNWTFGKGHLVVNGDVFDRGTKVTGCLWLIYMLENKAREAGGTVHFIIGNHEVMNLTGSLSYLHPDYRRFASMFGLNYMNFYDDHTVLGEWLRSKNIMEVIGDHLIVHAGVSQEMNTLGLSVEKINDMHRNWLASKSVAVSDTAAMKVILNSKLSPYWYRGYYPKKGAKGASEDVINKTLDLYKVNKIITGHTVVEDVSSFYNGKVINIDTKHAKGDSEGLLIENGNYYRVTLDGKKELLPISDKGKVSDK